MAYVHCHKCNWQQDDFWHRGYNPVKYFFTVELPMYIWPHFMQRDACWIFPTPLSERFGLTKSVKKVRAKVGVCDCCSSSKGYVPPQTEDTITVYYIHSWLALARSIRGWFRKAWNMKWWTYGSWNRAVAKNDDKWPPCPTCGNNLCMD
jgi:hypothetical protein